MRAYPSPRRFWPLAVLPLLLGGCALFGNPELPHPADSGPFIGTNESLSLIFSDRDTTGPARIQPASVGDRSPTLSLDQVQAIAGRMNPTFKEFEANREAARAEVLQAMAYPNPEIDLGVGIARTREEPKESAAEYGLGLAQPLEWPAKRKSRRAAAEASAPIVERETEGFRVTLRADVAKAYHTLLFHQRAIRVAQDALRMEQEIKQIVERRVTGGEAPEIDRVKAQVEVLKASRAVQEQRRKAASARAILNALCGRGLPAGFAIADTLEASLGGVNEAEARRIGLAQHPTLRRLQAVARQRELVIARERKAWYPDLRPGMNLGQEIDTRSIGAGIGMELPFWNRNQGGIAAATAELHKTQAELERVLQEVERDIETGVQTYESAREQLAAFSAGLRQAAAESLRIETFLYEEGEADFLQLLDARRTARQTETEYLQAMYDAHIARADLERAIGIGGNQ